MEVNKSLVGEVVEGVLQSLSSAIEGIAERTCRSVVTVESAGRVGSGTVWDESRVVTASHVVSGSEHVVLGIDGRMVPARVIGKERRSDLAVLGVEERMPPVSRGDSESVKVGQFVLALASTPAGKVSATSGIVTGTGVRVRDWRGLSIEEAISSDVRVNPGYSGGPLMDASGAMIGVNVAWLSSRAISVPTRRVNDLVVRLSSGRLLQRAFLGLTSSTIPIPDEEGKVPRSGTLVLSVVRGSPADRAGLVFGDVILRFDEEELEGPVDLERLLTEERIGKKAKLRLLRGGEIREIEVVPGAAPEE